MKQWSSDDDAQSQHVYPARDAERSTDTFDLEQHKTIVQAEAPIGVFDSGVGGFTILSALRKELPYEHYVYFGDTAHCPYGMRSDAEITDLSLQVCHFLLDQGAKLIVVACNTASQAALNVLRATFPISFVGVVPAVKPAARITRRGRIGVAATNHAVKAAYLHQLIDDFAGGIEVYATGCPELVMLVEQGKLDGPLVEETLQHALQPLLVKNVDVIVLGCTHFPAMRTAIEHVAGKQVQVIDSSAAIARRTRAILEAEGTLHRPNTDPPTMGKLTIWCSGDPTAFSSVASTILGYPVLAQHVTL